MQIFTYTRKYMHTYMHACVHAYVLIDRQTYTRAYIHTYIPISAQTLSDHGGSGAWIEGGKREGVTVGGHDAKGK